MTPGFHWFVAWRYLMAHPRRVSAAIVAVAGVVLLASAALGAIGDVILGHPDEGFLSFMTYRYGLSVAVVLFALSGVGVLAGVIGYTRRYPEHLGVPLAALLGLSLAAIGVLARGTGGSLGWLLTGTAPAAACVLLAAASWRAWTSARQRTGGWLTMFVLLAVAGGAALVIARQSLVPLPPLSRAYHADLVVLPSVGLLLLGVALALGVVVHCMVAGRVSRAGVVASLLVLVASGLYAVLIERVLPEAERIQYLPTGASVSLPAMWVGLGMVAAAVVLALVLALVRPLRARLAVWSAVAVVLAVAGAGLAGAAQSLFAPPEYLFLPAGSRPIHPLRLVAVVLLAVGELTLILGLVRHLFSFFTTVSIAGVAVGSMALVIVLSVMSGFESDLRNKILGSNAHMLITKDDGSFTEYRDIAAQVEQVPDVEATTPYLVSEVVIAASGNYNNAIIKGIDPASVGDVTELGKNAEQPRALERLWPLADDGGILGPPRDGGVEEDRADAAASPGAGEVGTGEAGTGAQTPDPPPADLDAEIGEPLDMSGGEAPDELDALTGGAEDEPGAAEPPSASAGAAASEAVAASPGELVDPPPADFEGAIVEPLDMSGAEPGAGVAGTPPVLIDPDLAAPLLDLGHPDAMPSIPARVARLPGVLVGKELVKQLHLYVGQEVRVVSPLAEDTPAGPVPRTRFLRVAGTFFTGMYEYDLNFVYVPLEVLQTFLDLDDEVTGIEIRISDPDDTGAVLQEVRERLPAGYRVQDWKEINRSLFAALKLEKIAMFLVLAIVILVASFSIIGNLVMVVVEKSKEIAVIKALGASNTGVMKIFIAQGFFIGWVGTLLGVVHGLIACVLLEVYGFPLQAEVYYIDRLPVHVEGLGVVAVFVAGLFISILATLYPAAVGARLRPIEGLRYE